MSYFKFFKPPRRRVVSERYPARQVTRCVVLRNDKKCVALTLSCRHIVHRPRFGPAPLEVELVHEIAHCEHCPRRKCA